jgi:hypothetical protein
VKRLLIVFLFFTSILLLSSNPSRAERKNLGIALYYPGLGFRYGFNDRIAVEGRFQSESGINVTGARGYIYFGEKFGIPLFAGGGLHTISFAGEVSRGIGTALEGFAGGEYFVTDSFSVQFELLLAIISLSDSSYAVTDAAADIDYSIGINWYFGKGPDR